MPTLEYTDDELGLRPGWDEGLDPNIRRELREARKVSKQNEEMASRIANLEREQSFARAGIPAGPRAELFAQHYKGAVEDSTAVKAAYEELFGPVTTSPSDAGASTDATTDTSGDRRVADATAAGTSEGTPGVVRLEDAIRGAKNWDELREIIRNAPPEAGISLPES